MQGKTSKQAGKKGREKQEKGSPGGNSKKSQGVKGSCI